MKLKTRIGYMESYLPTPRSRKPHYRQEESYIDAEIRELTIQDLRPAFEAEGETLYLYHNRLFVRAKVCDFYANGSLVPTALDALKYQLENGNRFVSDRTEDTLETIADRVSKYMELFLLVDGTLFCHIGEPRYMIRTFGMGHNHGGTCLDVVYHQNQDDQPWAYYCALDGNLAVTDAIEVAKIRCDTESIPRIRAGITVLLPEAVQLPRRPVDPFSVIQSALHQRRPVKITDGNHIFEISELEGCCLVPGSEGIDAVLSNGLRLQLPLREDLRNTLTWNIDSNEDDVFIQIQWNFLDKPRR